MPDLFQELDLTFWTSFSRRGCVGNFKNCFPNNNLAQLSFLKDKLFWSTFDRTDTGACIALQSLPFASLAAYSDLWNFRVVSGPVFMACTSLHYFACVANRVRADIVDETKLQVNYYFCKKMSTIPFFKNRQQMTKRGVASHAAGCTLPRVVFQIVFLPVLWPFRLDFLCASEAPLPAGALAVWVAAAAPWPPRWRPKK